MGVSYCAMNHLSLYRQGDIQSALRKGICAQFHGGPPGIRRTTQVDLWRSGSEVPWLPSCAPASGFRRWPGREAHSKHGQISAIRLAWTEARRKSMQLPLLPSGGCFWKHSAIELLTSAIECGGKTVHKHTCGRDRRSLVLPSWECEGLTWLPPAHNCFSLD